MQIVIRDNPSSAPEKVEVDLRDPPSVIRAEQHPGLEHTVSLDWDRALDDHLHLRRCPVCRCPDLYTRQPVPRMTAFILVLLAAVIAMVLFGFDMATWAVVALIVVLIIDIGILVVSRPILVCYRCGTQYRRLKIPRQQPKWDAALAERHRDKRAPQRIDPPANEAAEPVS